MSEHRLTDEGIRRALRSALKRMLIFFGVIECFVAYYATTKSDSFLFIAGMMGMTAFALAIGFYRGWRRLRNQLTTYVVTLDDDRIRRDIRSMPSIEVARIDVTAIEERRPGGLAVYGVDRRNFVGVNDDMAGYATVRQQVAGWHPIEEKPPARGIAAIAMLALTVVAFAVTIISHNRFIVAAVGSALAIAIVVSGVSIYRSPHFDRKTKRILFILPLPLAAIIVRIVWARRRRGFPRVITR